MIGLFWVCVGWWVGVWLVCFGCYGLGFSFQFRIRYSSLQCLFAFVIVFVCFCFCGVCFDCFAWWLCLFLFCG